MGYLLVLCLIGVDHFMMTFRLIYMKNYTSTLSLSFILFILVFQFRSATESAVQRCGVFLCKILKVFFPVSLYETY